MEKNNPSYECMRRAREESRAELLEMRRWDVSRRLKALQLPESGSHDMLSRIAKVIYPTTIGWTREACEYLRDQLVDLIGGERDAQHGCSGGAGGCDCRHESEEVDGQSRTCPESGPDVSESDDGMSIMSELREYLDLNGQEFTNYKDELIATISGGTSVLYAIADRIDEQFARICKQQEKVFQDTISEMLDEIDRQKDLRDENAKVAEDAIHSSCMYLDLLRDAARDYKRLHDDYVELSHDHRELYGFAKAIEREIGENEFVTLFGVDYVPYFHIEHLSNTLSKVTGKWAKADAECRMYREMLNDAAKEYKALLEKLSIAFNMWVSATGGGE